MKLACMTKKQKPLIARKTSIGILVLIIINIVIAWATIHQRTIWLGHTESSKQNHTVSAEQFKDNLIMNVVYYEPGRTKLSIKNCTLTTPMQRKITIAIR